MPDRLAAQELDELDELSATKVGGNMVQLTLSAGGEVRAVVLSAEDAHRAAKAIEMAATLAEERT